MPYAGKTLMPRDIASRCFNLTPWRNYELTKAIGTALGESAGSLGAWHDNLNLEGQVSSRDCGLYQINIPDHAIGTAEEMALRTDSLEMAIWNPVSEYNVTRALALYNQDWIRDGKADYRRWQPWVAYTSGWVTFPEWWVWHQDMNGNPIGPWLPTGRYIHRAIAGQLNLHVVILQDWTIEQALYYGARYLKHFGIKQGTLTEKKGVVGWTDVPPKPTQEPDDGIGPRPVPNDGI